jgi:hypothetical protein
VKVVRLSHSRRSALREYIARHGAVARIGETEIELLDLGVPGARIDGPVTADVQRFLATLGRPGQPTKEEKEQTDKNNGSAPSATSQQNAGCRSAGEADRSPDKEAERLHPSQKRATGDAGETPSSGDHPPADETTPGENRGFKALSGDGQPDGEGTRGPVGPSDSTQNADDGDRPSSGGAVPSASVTPARQSGESSSESDVEHAGSDEGYQNDMPSGADHDESDPKGISFSDSLAMVLKYRKCNLNNFVAVATLKNAKVTRNELEKARTAFARLVLRGGEDEEAGPRWRARDIAAKTAGYLRPWAVEDRRLEEGRPALLILVDVSASMGVWAKKLCSAALALHSVAPSVVVSHINARRIVEIWRDGRNEKVSSEYIHEAASAAAQFIALARRYDLRAIVAVGDDDGLEIYSQIASSYLDIPFIHLSNYGCNYGPPRLQPTAWRYAERKPANVVEVDRVNGDSLFDALLLAARALA